MFRRVPCEVRRGVAGALADEVVDGVCVLQRWWHARLPLGVLHRLPPVDRDVCLGF